jgi:predicted DNA-binding transcriptional regulator AlpA
MPKEDTNETIKRLEPDEVVRWTNGPKYFGLKKSQQDEAVKRGEIPQPFKLTASGRATGWTGQQIIEHHRQRMAASKKQA